MEKMSEVKFRRDKLSLDPHPSPPISTSILLTSGSLMTPEELRGRSTCVGVAGHTHTQSTPQSPPKISHYIIPLLKLELKLQAESAADTSAMMKF